MEGLNVTVPESSLSAVVSWFEVHEGQYFDLVLAGQVFGGRYGEASQCVKSVSFKSDSLRIQFNPSGALSIIAPKNIILEPQGLFVSLASEIIFGWHHYGREQIPENWCEVRYSFSGNHVSVERLDLSDAPSESFLFESKYAVVLVRGG